MSTAHERPDRFAGLSAEKRALLEKWVKGAGKTPSRQAIPRRSESGPAPLSFVQEWYFQHRINEPAAFLLEGPLDRDILEQSIQEIVRRHDILRTTFKHINDKPMQVIEPTFALHLPPIESLEDLPASERLAHGLRLGQQDTETVIFPLEEGPTWRIRLLRLAPEQHLCIALFAAIIVDGRSQINFCLELSQLYEAFAAGLPSPLPELPIQFADFATWQRERLQGAAWDAYLAYWRPQLADTPRLNVPTDVPRAAVARYQRDLLRLEIPRHQAEALRTLSRAEQCSMFACLFALFQVLIYRFTGQQDLLIGIEVTSRQLRETMELIGCFTHTMPIRMSITDELDFKTLLHQVQKRALDVNAHHDLSTGGLVALCDPERDLLKTPLFSVKAAYFTNVARPARQKEPRLALIPQTLNGIDEPPEDLNLQMFDFEDGLALHLEYHAGLFQRSTIARLLDTYAKLLAAIAANPELSIERLLQML